MNTLKRSIISSIAVIMAFNTLCMSNIVEENIVGDNSSMVVSALDTNDMYITSSSDIFVPNVLSKTPWNTSEVNNTYIQSNDDGTISRIVYNGDTSSVVVEYYSPNFELISTKNIEMELPVWGAFYSGSEYNFCVFGQNNPNESDDVEVVRIVKYSKDWQRLDSASFYGCNTETPFRAGRPRLTEHDGKLYLHTSHRMYKSSDGYNHQANMDFYINIQDMSLFYQNYNVSNIDYSGYMSHSFDQYILADASNLYSVDLGDAYPRSVSIVKRNLDGSIVGNKSVLDIYGTIGDNATGVSLGGFELSADSCLTLGSATVQDGSASSNYQRNIFLSVTSKDLSSNNFIWLTNFTEDSMVSIPKLVKVDDNTFIAMWNEVTQDGSDAMHVMKLDAQGNILEDVYMDAVASDCDPIIVGNQIVWYYSGYTYDSWGFATPDGTKFYSFDYTNLAQNNVDKSLLGDYNSDGKVNSSDLLTLKKYLLGIEDSINVTNADLNADEKVNISDLLILKKYLLGLATL